MKEFLSRNRVSFDVMTLTSETNRLEFERRASGRAPLTIIGGETVTGYEPQKLRTALERAGLLDAASDSAESPSRERAGGLGRPLSGCVAVANFLGDSVTFLDARSAGYLVGEEIEGSSVHLAGHPIALEPCPLGGTLAAVNYEGGSASFLSLEDGSHAFTTKTGMMPLHALAHPQIPLVYVSNSESRDVTVLDPATGDYAFGSRSQSSATLQGQPGIMALSPEGTILYVRLREGAVVMLRAEDLAPWRGDLESSAFPTGRGRGIALSSDGQRLFVPEALGGADGLGIYRVRTGTPERARLATDPVPFAIAAHPSRPIVYVSCFGSNVIELRDANTGDYLFDSPETSSVAVGAGARAMLVDPETETLYVSCFDEGSVITLDAGTGRYRNATRTRSTLRTGAGPRGMALLP